MANAGSHVAALILIIAVALTAWPLSPPGAGHVPRLAMAVYLVTMLLLYATSALYHALPAGAGKRVLVKLDYCAIYLFIAGSYTPFAVGILSGHGGTALLIIIWILAAAGIALQAFRKLAHPFLSVGFYLAMGWMVLGVAWPLFTLLPGRGIGWLLAGALCYTGGTIFFLLDSRLKFAHSIWHLCVISGSACHFFAIAKYA
ncbi:MAG: PAQR family membrane homeostasis protein TrhA [Janthinobacterium lividum]